MFEELTVVFVHKNKAALLTLLVQNSLCLLKCEHIMNKNAENCYCVHFLFKKYLLCIQNGLYS